MNRSQFYFLFAGVLTFLAGFLLSGSNTNTVVNVHDTYAVLPIMVVTTIMALILVLGGLLYWVLNYTKRNTSPWLTRLHALVALGAVLAVLILGLFLKLVGFENETTQADIMVLLCFIFLAAQLFLVINIFVGLFQGKRK